MHGHVTGLNSSTQCFRRRTPKRAGKRYRRIVLLVRRDRSRRREDINTKTHLRDHYSGKPACRRDVDEFARRITLENGLTDEQSSDCLSGSGSSSRCLMETLWGSRGEIEKNGRMNELGWAGYVDWVDACRSIPATGDVITFDIGKTQEERR